MNVWDMTWRQWLMFSAATDEWIKARKEAAK